jgi:hypothetical protein
MSKSASSKAGETTRKPGTFQKGDARINRHGQVKGKTVELSALLKQYLTDEGNADISITPQDGRAIKIKKAQALAKVIWAEALKGNIQFVKELIERIMGKVPQAVTGPDGGPIDHAVNVKVTFVDTKG